MPTPPKLFLVHCGYANADLAGGIFEAHVDLFVAAEDFADARLKAKALPEYRARKMHIDGLIEVTRVEGFRVELKKDEPGSALRFEKGFSFRGRKKKGTDERD